MERIETSIFKGLMYDRDYSAAVLPFLNDEVFSDTPDKIIYHLINEYIDKYKKLPAKEALIISLNDKPVGEDDHASCIDILNEIVETKDERADTDWLKDQTESFVRDKSIYNAIFKSIEILDGQDENASKHGIPKMLEEALAISFDTNVGHDYMDDVESRYEYYTREEARIPFDIAKLNEVTAGGTPNKTLNIIMADTNAGKSLCLCHFAASWIKQGKNVLYISMEMDEESVSERIDANLMMTPTNKLKTLSREDFMGRFQKVRSKVNGKLIVKQFPTAGAHVGHFRHLLNELKLKKGFKPDIICLDYINICASSRIKAGAGANSYSIVKAIAEEVRGLAVEFDVPIWSATQANREGAKNATLSLTDISESYGLAATADFIAGIVVTEELMELNQYLWCLMKTRYGSKQGVKNFVTGVDYSTQRLYDVQETVNEELHKIREEQGSARMTERVSGKGKGISTEGWNFGN